LQIAFYEITAPAYKEILQPETGRQKLQYDIVGNRDTRKLINDTLTVPFGIAVLFKRM
jgi:hypothetical protein